MSVTLKPIPEGLFQSGTRHLAVFAHQDDDLGYSGLLQRIRDNASVMWVTNGDGLAPFENMDPHEYSTMRTNESIAALRILGYREKQLVFLHHSELDIYDDFRQLAISSEKGRIPDELKDRVLHRARSIEHRLQARVDKADVVWVNAWQGGHPEHDLVHFLTARAVARTRKKGRRVALMELPQYEILFFVPLRFPPWRFGPAHLIELSTREIQLKEQALKAYRSQLKITNAFKKLVGLYGLASALRLKPFTFKGFARKEWFAPVPEDRNYRLSPHRVDWFDYINEYHENKRISFNKSIQPIVDLVS